MTQAAAEGAVETRRMRGANIPAPLLPRTKQCRICDNRTNNIEAPWVFGWDVIDLEKSRKMTVVIKPDGFPSYPSKGGYPFIHLKSEAVGSAHLFRIVGLGQAIF